MIKKTHEVVITFRDESGEIIGILLQNGKTQFLRTTHANKEHVAQLLEVDDKKEGH